MSLNFFETQQHTAQRERHLYQYACEKVCQPIEKLQSNVANMTEAKKGNTMFSQASMKAVMMATRDIANLNKEIKNILDSGMDYQHDTAPTVR